MADWQEGDRGDDMTTKHTPGPWAVNPFKARVDAFDGPNASPLPICKMFWPTNLRSEDETEANARLIAASPDLLAALEELQSLADAMGDTTNCGMCNESIIKARAAIAKARGERT